MKFLHSETIRAKSMSMALVRVFKISIVSSQLGNGTYMAFPSLPGIRMAGSTASIFYKRRKNHQLGQQ